MKTFPTLLLLLVAAYGITGCGGGAAPAEAAEMTEAAPDKLSFEFVVEGVKLAVPVIGVSGLGTQTTVVDRPDGDLATPDKTAGPTTSAGIVLERGYTATDDLWEWRKEVEGGLVVRRNATLTVRNAAGDAIARYNLIDCWPTSWNIGLVNTKSEQLTETVTLVCESIQRVSP